MERRSLLPEACWIIGSARNNLDCRWLVWIDWASTVWGGDGESPCWDSKGTDNGFCKFWMLCLARLACPICVVWPACPWEICWPCLSNVDLSEAWLELLIVCWLGTLGPGISDWLKGLYPCGLCTKGTWFCTSLLTIGDCPWPMILWICLELLGDCGKPSLPCWILEATPKLCRAFICLDWLRLLCDCWFRLCLSPSYWEDELKYRFGPYTEALGDVAVLPTPEIV